MNFRTTLILLIVLGAVGLFLLFTRDSGETASTQTAETPSKLIELTPADVTAISIDSSDGAKTVLEKTDGTWRLSEPVKAAADPMAVNSLIETIAGLQTVGQVPASDATGLDKPRYTLNISRGNGAPIKLDVGTRSAAGNSLYVHREGQSQGDVVGAELADKLDLPLKQWRQARLFDISAPQITQLRVATTQQSIALEKQGMDWKMSQPTSMPADVSAVSDITTAISGLRAEDFIERSPDQAKKYGLEKPVVSVAFSTAPPSTQPSTTAPAMTTIEFGRYDSLLKKNVYASISGEPGIVLVPSAVLERFHRTPLELRDKQVLNIDPQVVNKIQIAIDRPATTQPTTREAFHDTVVMERIKQMTGPFLPTSKPSTSASPTTAEAATHPAEAEPPTYTWLIRSRDGMEADETKVQTLLRSLHPLRATKFLTEMPSGKTDQTIMLTVGTPDKVHQLRTSDQGAGQPAIVEYDGLMFETSPTIVEDMTANFAEKTPPPPAMPEGMMPPGMMGGMGQ